jgi:putative FmdB family regulatory protein
MPIYTYICESCGKEVSVIRDILARDDYFPCRECGHPTQRKVVQPVEIHVDGGTRKGYGG